MAQERVDFKIFTRHDGRANLINMRGSLLPAALALLVGLTCLARLHFAGSLGIRPSDWAGNAYTFRGFSNDFRGALPSLTLGILHGREFALPAALRAPDDAWWNSFGGYPGRYGPA